MNTGRLLALVLLLMAGLVGCMADENYEACEYPPAQEKVCVSSAGVEISTSCVTEHPECPDGYCVAYTGSEPFCSMTCDGSDDDCPGEATCVGFALGCDGTEADASACTFYCVPNDVRQ